MFQHTLASLSNRPPVTLTCSTFVLRSIADPNIFFTFQLLGHDLEGDERFDSLGGQCIFCVYEYGHFY